MVVKCGEGKAMFDRGPMMSDKELEAALKALDQADERAERSAQHARRVLVEEGVCTADGELTELYR